MNLSDELQHLIFTDLNEDGFEDLAIEIFRQQNESNRIYRQFVRFLGIDPARIRSTSAIPFLPVQFFRDHRIISGSETGIQKVFSSSGTTGSIPSRHYIRDLDLYENSFTRSFKRFYGDPENYRFLALLPGYLEREDSSLVYMMDHFIRKTAKNGSGFYLNDFDSLNAQLAKPSSDHIRTILFGASFALLDFSEQYPMDLGRVIVMETGGMKGRRKELIREELHEILCTRFNVSEIHSEYGMTELLSQAYSQGNGIFRCPPWMKVLIRDTNDPMQVLQAGQTGGISIIDLANIQSCSFIATQDLGKLHPDGSFEVLGRFDDSDIRGCNLLVV